MLSHEYAMPAFDLVKSLRTHARDRDRDAWMNCEEAADEIERLRAALRDIAEDQEGDYDFIVWQARDALGEKE